MRKVEREQNEDQGNPTKDPEISRIRKLDARDESTVEQEPECKVNLRIEGIAHDVIWKDEARVGKIQEVVEIQERLIHEIYSGRSEETSKLCIFSEESSRIIHELGKIEVYELGHMSSTIQCHSCWKHLPEGLAFYSCGVCLRPDEATIKKDQSKIPSFDCTRINRSRDKKHGETQWQQDHWKAMDARRGAWKHGKRTLLKSGGNKMESTEILSKPMDGRKNIADTWTASRRSTSLTPHPGIRGTGTRAPSRWHATMRIVNLDQ